MNFLLNNEIFIKQLIRVKSLSIKPHRHDEEETSQLTKVLNIHLNDVGLLTHIYTSPTL